MAPKGTKMNDHFIGPHWTRRWGLLGILLFIGIVMGATNPENHQRTRTVAASSQAPQKLRSVFHCDLECQEDERLQDIEELPLHFQKDPPCAYPNTYDPQVDDREYDGLRGRF